MTDTFTHAICSLLEKKKKVHLVIKVGVNISWNNEYLQGKIY